MFFTLLDPMPYIVWPPMFAWATSVAVSRLLMYRHHILDVFAGVLLGCLEAFLLSIIWLNQPTSAWILTWLSDEGLPSGTTQEETL